MGKRQDESSKYRGVRATNAKAMSASEVIMTMTAKEAKALRANFKAVRSRRARGRDEE